MSRIASPPTGGITAADLLAMPNEEEFELVDGQLKAKGVWFESSWLGAHLVGLLHPYCTQQKLGWILGPDVGYQCFARDSQRVRRPDVSFISLQKIPADHSPIGYIPTPPDLAAEFVSPNDLAEEVYDKINDFRDAGVSLIWVFYPSADQVCVYRPSGVQILSSEDELLGHEVIPGFRVKVADVLSKLGTS